jgi:hypothetical protein
VGKNEGYSPRTRKGMTHEGDYDVKSTYTRSKQREIASLLFTPYPRHQRMEVWMILFSLKREGDSR